jgi:hypothetical protein
MVRSFLWSGYDKRGCFRHQVLAKTEEASSGTHTDRRSRAGSSVREAKTQNHRNRLGTLEDLNRADAPNGANKHVAPDRFRGIPHML